jgi:hypothetical protein
MSAICHSPLACSPSSLPLDSDFLASSPLPCDARSPFPLPPPNDHPGGDQDPLYMEMTTLSVECGVLDGTRLSIGRLDGDASEFWSLHDDAAGGLVDVAAAAAAATAITTPTTTTTTTTDADSATAAAVAVATAAEAGRSYRQKAVLRYLEKRAQRRLRAASRAHRHRRRLQNGVDILRYSSRQAIARSRPRVRGRFVSTGSATAFA